MQLGSLRSEKKRWKGHLCKNCLDISPVATALGKRNCPGLGCSSIWCHRFWLPRGYIVGAGKSNPEMFHIVVRKICGVADLKAAMADVKLGGWLTPSSNSSSTLVFPSLSLTFKRCPPSPLEKSKLRVPQPVSLLLWRVVDFLYDRRRWGLSWNSKVKADGGK